MMIFSGIIFGLLSVGSLAPMQTTKDEFVFNNKSEPETLDPQFLSGTPEGFLAIQLYEGLLTRKADWATLAPGLAEKIPKPTNNGKTYTYTLRPNLKWSDGSPLTAKDVEYSWLRAIDPKTAAPFVNWLTDFVIGAAEYNKNPTPENAKKLGFKATDDRTFVVNLTQPVPYFNQLTAEPLTSILKKDVIEKWKDQFTKPEHFVGCGPYILKEWKVQDKIVMERNPFYYDAKNVKTTRVVALPINDEQTAVNLFKQGKIDWTGQNGAPHSLASSFKADPAFRLNPAFVNYYYWFNTERPPFNDKRVRQALTLAIDRKQLVETVTKAGEIPGGSFVPSVGDYKAAPGILSADQAADIKKAQKLLAEAGFPGGKGFKKFLLIYNTNENHKKIALAIQQMWKKNLSIDTVLDNSEWKVFIKKQSAMDFDMSRSGWAGDYPDPGTFLEVGTSMSGNNHGNWKNAKYDDLLLAANSIQDEKKRNKKLAEAEAFFLEEAPVIPLFRYVNFSFVRPEVVGFEPNLLDRPYVRYFSKK